MTLIFLRNRDKIIRSRILKLEMHLNPEILLASPELSFYDSKTRVTCHQINIVKAFDEHRQQ